MADPMSDPVMRRKVMPIYNALDSQNNKQAVKLCSKKDVASFPLVKALKAVACSRLEQLAEAQELCNSVIATCPVDDTLLSTLRLTLKSIGDFDGILAMYEQALAKHPGNYVLAKEVLSACIGAGDFVKLQMLCLKFARQFSEMGFALWAAASIVLQADNNEEGQEGMYAFRSICV
jgi:tetratricopeptide (TPR) repeat protein